MFNCMKVKVDKSQVVMTREELARGTTPVSGPLLPLTVENLPWDDDTRMENEKYVYKYVSNMSTNWYRTRTVILNRKSVWKLQRFVDDLHTKTRYTIDEMENILGIQRQKTPEDWKSILMKPGLPEFCPKLPKPFHITPEHILSEVKSVTNTLHDIGNRIRDISAPKQSTDKLHFEEIGEVSADEVFGHLPKIQIELMYKAHIDLVVKYGLYENSYIQLMTLGEQQENDEVEAKKAKSKLLEVWQPVKEKKPIKKTLTYWYKLQKSKIKEKTRKEKLKRRASRQFESISKHLTITDRINKAKSDIVCSKDSYRGIEKNNDSDEKLQTAGTTEDFKDISDYSDSNGRDHTTREGNETTDDDAPAVFEIDEDMSDSTCTIATYLDTEQDIKKKKRRGFLRRVTAPFRWIKKRVGS